MNSTLLTWLKTLSRICGFETADSFPPGHPYARTRWEAAYFDIASDVKPDEIERRICAAIANTPSVFAYITNPTPRMQRALLNVIHDRLRRQPGAGATDLVLLLINAYASEHITEAVPGLRALIVNTEQEETNLRVHAILELLVGTPRGLDVIDM
ncbi:MULTISPECIES: hypothetical protein [unclassified Janthinobacterium]|uniref:hypothetical protein n=1 Tax=unclassified Janthinobacterium TaxID=2610881 RepID=UPI00088C8862|nr:MULTISPECIES: hypothetical protein [unclassified Janthinobacterium]SDA38449.1 hypothetical protein SAMN03159349_00067 [Janthinobacterium sp. 551a]SFA77578.1 hypothetical protein SAMN03159300_10167 [Janthinobacterium sp. 344]